MPGIYAHYCFGKRSLSLFDTSLRQILKKERPAFDLGLQGADIFYYGSVFCGPRGRDFADRLHELSGRAVLETYLATAKLKEDRPFGAISDGLLAYMLGFIGHFTLDSLCHPYVNAVSSSAREHLALETDFDVVLLEQDGIAPWTCATHKICPHSGRLLHVLLDFYAPFSAGYTPREVVRAAFHAHRALRLRRTPTHWRYRMLTALLGVSGQNDYKAVLLVPPDPDGRVQPQWPDKPEQAMEKLKVLFDAGLPLFREHAEALRERLEKGCPLPPFFDRNFNQE